MCCIPVFGVKIILHNSEWGGYHGSWGFSNMGWFCQRVCHYIYVAHLSQSKYFFEGVAEGGHDGGDEHKDGGDESSPLLLSSSPSS